MNVHSVCLGVIAFLARCNLFQLDFNDGKKAKRVNISIRKLVLIKTCRMKNRILEYYLVFLDMCKRCPLYSTTFDPRNINLILRVYIGTVQIYVDSYLKNKKTNHV